MKRTETADDVDATVRVAEGRVIMQASVTDTLYVETPEHRPLSGVETHLSLRVESEDVRTTIDVDAEALEVLADAVAWAQGGEEA